MPTEHKEYTVYKYRFIQLWATPENVVTVEELSMKWNLTSLKEGKTFVMIKIKMFSKNLPNFPPFSLAWGFLT